MAWEGGRAGGAGGRGKTSQGGDYLPSSTAQKGPQGGQRQDFCKHCTAAHCWEGPGGPYSTSWWTVNTLPIGVVWPPNSAQAARYASKDRILARKTGFWFNVHPCLLACCLLAA